MNISYNGFEIQIKSRTVFCMLAGNVIMDGISDISIENFRSKITFGPDLLEGALKQISFLQHVDRNRKLYEDAVLHQAFRRYEELWLPLAAQQRDKTLAAPLDIEWIWHCHMLSPVCYEEDCKATVGLTVNHRLLSEKEREKALDITKQLWSSLYPDEKFELELSSSGDGATTDIVLEEASKINYNVIEAAKRQRVFAYQVSLPHYTDRLFLKRAVERYQKMLYLKLQNPRVFLVPCYDIDLIWHTHQLHPLMYKEDTTGLLGQMFNHDDSVNDRNPGSRLNQADKRTRELWRETFNENFSVYGAMFRGDPPSGLQPITLDEMFSFSTKKANIHLDRMQVDGLPANLKNFKIKINYVASEKEGPSITSFKGPERNWERKKSGSAFCFDTKLYNCIKFKLVQMLRPMCFSSSEQLAQNVFHMLPVVENLNRGDTKIYETVMLDEEHNVKVSFTADVQVHRKPGPCLLFLKNGNYEPRFCIMPEHIKQMWGPIPLPRLPTGKDNHCLVASHK